MKVRIENKYINNNLNSKYVKINQLYVTIVHVYI